MSRDTHEWAGVHVAPTLVDEADSAPRLPRRLTSKEGAHHAALRCNVLRDCTDRGSARIQWSGRNVGQYRLAVRRPGGGGARSGAGVGTTRHTSAAVNVLRDSGCVLFGVLVGTTICSVVSHPGFAADGTISAASLGVVAMLLGSLRDSPSPH